MAREENTARQLNEIRNQGDAAGGIRPDGSPYLELLSYRGGGGSGGPVNAQSSGVEKLEIMKEMWWRSGSCGKVANKFRGAKTGQTYFARIPCRKWWCETCGARKGEINRKRAQAVKQKIGVKLETATLREIVLTLPEDLVPYFETRKALNSLIRMSAKVMKKHFQDLPGITSLHLFDSKGKGKYRPHTHSVIFDRIRARAKLPLEELAAIREDWRFALQGFVRRPVEKVVVHVSYTRKMEKKHHMIGYVTRPVPGAMDLAALKYNIDLLGFCMVDMQGFSFIRYFNKGKCFEIKDPTAADAVRDMAGAAGEPLIFVLHGQMTMTEFYMRYRPKDYDELTSGFYRIHAP